MNRVELARKVAAENALSQAAAERVLRTVVETIVTTVRKGGGVDLGRLKSALGPNNPRKTARFSPKTVRLTPIDH